MWTILLKFGVRTRNWPRTDLQPLEFNFELYFCRFMGPRFAEFQQRVKIVVSVSSSKPVQDHRKSFKIIILTGLRFISLKKATKNALSAK